MNALEEQWLVAKQAEDAAKKERLDIEKQILRNINNPETGTISYGELKISFGYNDKWDDDALEQLKQSVKPEYFPFKTSYKPEKKKLDAIKDIEPTLYSKITEALTLTPKKPSFKYAGDK